MAHSRSVLNLSDPQDDSRSPENTVESSQSAKSSAPANDAENAPLLTYDSDEPNNEAQNGSVLDTAEPKKERALALWRRCFRWVLENVMFVIVACLLAAGTVALCVYFGGNISIPRDYRLMAKSL